MKRWEQELWRCVLTPEEKNQGYFWRHNVNALLRGDFATRMSGYSTALQNGFMSQNEVRDLEDWNGFPGGDDYHIQLNMQQLPTAPGNPPAQQQGSLVRLNNGSKYRRVS
jgi:phage portal protein BeeE